MFRRRSLLRIARLLLGAFLLAQSALALAACDWSARDAARAVALAAGGADASCHEANADVGLCLTHCLGVQQSLDKPAVAAPAPAAFAELPQARVMPAASWRERPLATSAPPPRILFQSFLI